ncbi:MAG TPA: exopolysaccharide biosynthesis protein [Candidatus Saccharimonadales bacterium]|nr:exopolysaccharide biosynthesis protein [Candidatus Saccharimonadales bacterium]
MTTRPQAEELFSDRLARWFSGVEPKTVEGLNKVFAEKSLGIIIFVLMFVPALPLPTGGVSHVFELVAMLLALQLVVGMRTIWLPKRLSARPIPALAHPKVTSNMLRVVRWMERFSQPRFGRLLRSQLGLMIIGLLLFGLSLAAFLAPPFSGLDTFPSIGVVIIALALIFEDALALLIGVIAGAAGVALVVGLGTEALHLVRSLL